MAILVTIQVELHQIDEEYYRVSTKDSSFRKHALMDSVDHGHYVIVSTIDEGPEYPGNKQ